MGWHPQNAYIATFHESYHFKESHSVDSFIFLYLHPHFVRGLFIHTWVMNLSKLAFILQCSQATWVIQNDFYCEVLWKSACQTAYAHKTWTFRLQCTCFSIPYFNPGTLISNQVGMLFITLPPTYVCLYNSQMVKNVSSPLLLDIEQDVLTTSTLQSGARPGMDQALCKPFQDDWEMRFKVCVRELSIAWQLVRKNHGMVIISPIQIRRNWTAADMVERLSKAYIQL